MIKSTLHSPKPLAWVFLFLLGIAGLLAAIIVALNDHEGDTAIIGLPDTVIWPATFALLAASIGLLVSALLLLRKRRPNH